MGLYMEENKDTAEEKETEKSQQSGMHLLSLPVRYRGSRSSSGRKREEDEKKKICEMVERMFGCGHVCVRTADND